MKKYYLIFAALFAIAAVSCQKETGVTEENVTEEQTPDPVATTSDDVVIFTASMPESPLTKTVIGAEDGGHYQPIWTAEDEIIVNGIISTNTEVLNGGLSARFTIPADPAVTPPYVALAPGNKLAHLTYNGETKTCQFLVAGAGSPQVYTVNGTYPTYSPEHAVIGAYGTDENLTFKHLCSYFMITVDAANSTDDENIRYVYIRNGDETLLAGDWTATYSAGGISLAQDTNLSAVTLDCGDSGIAQGTPMMIAVPAINYSSGLIITLKDVSGHFASYKIKSTAAQFGTNPGTVAEFNPAFSPVSGMINSVDDWEAFAAAMNSANDFDRYRWVGNGTVKLGADISTADLTRVYDFNYSFDGQNHTIERTAATTNLFAHIYGSVSNLILDGSLSASSQTAPLAYDLKDGGSITNCTNNMSVTFDGTNDAYVGGLVIKMLGGSITGCTNNGAISVSVDNSEADHNINVGGIVAQIYPEAHNVTLTNCTNSATGDIIVTPKSAADNSFGAVVNGVGGIAGWLRGTDYRFTLTNCDNSGDITISGANITSPNGCKKYSASMGGIIGIGSNISTSLGALNTPSGTNGLKISFYNCDNDGLLTNCYAINSDGAANNMRIYTGGIAGSLMGNSDDYIELDKCTNTGDIITYNLTGSGKATTPGYTQVAGGLVGFGGYLAVSNKSRVVCEIGDRKRPAFAYAGVIGTALRPFSVDDSTIWVTLNMVRLRGANCNNGSVAALPYTFLKNDGKTTLTLSPAPIFGDDYASIIITNSFIGGNLNYTDLAAGNYEDTADKSGSSPSTLALPKTRAIRGNASSNITSTPGSIDVSTDTNLNAAP